MKRIVLQIGHWDIESITSQGLRNWRSSDILKRSTGASGERNYHMEKVMPLLRDKLIEAGVQVYIANAIYQQEIYQSEYDLWVSLHYDGGGTGERCMISAPNRTTQPAYLNEHAQSEAERFAQIWKTTYPEIVGVPNRDDRITAAMKDYYAYDYVGLDTPSVIIEHFNHTSVRGTYLKTHPELVAEGDFKAIAKFLEVSLEPPITSDAYKVVYKGEVLQEYEFNPTDRIQELADEIEIETNKSGKTAIKLGTCKTNLQDATDSFATQKASLTRSNTERDTAKTALSVAEKALKTCKAEKTILQKKIDALESTNPLGAYSGLQLIIKGINKIIRRG